MAMKSNYQKSTAIQMANLIYLNGALHTNFGLFFKFKKNGDETYNIICLRPFGGCEGTIVLINSLLGQKLFAKENPEYDDISFIEKCLLEYSALYGNGENIFYADKDEFITELENFYGGY